MQDFRNLVVWQKAHRLVLAVYRATRTFPHDEVYGLVSQMRRAAASIGANLAEGSARSSDAEFARFASMAAGSASELEYHVLLARDLDYLSTEDAARLEEGAKEVRRMLASLLDSLRGVRDGGPSAPVYPADS